MMDDKDFSLQQEDKEKIDKPILSQSSQGFGN